MQHEAVQLLSEYLQIDTTNPPGNEHKGAAFFSEIFEKEGVVCRRYKSDQGRTSLSARIQGSGEEDPLILLNHIDVVPAEKEQWHFDPFGGEVKDGFVHGRGALDMKGQGIMELLAFLSVKRSGRQPNRDLVFLAVADEECSGVNGADFLLQNHPDDFTGGLVLNEGGFGVNNLLPDRPLFLISTAEKACNWMEVSAQGPPGHGSVPHADNALERLIRGLNRLQEMESPIIITDTVAEYFRRLANVWDFLEPYKADGKQDTLIKCLLESGFSEVPQVSAILRNTVSTNVITAGSSVNVIPSHASAKLDVRLLPGQDPDEFRARVVERLGDDQLQTTFINKDRALASPFNTPAFEAIESVFSRHFPSAVVAPSVLFGSSDSRFFRERGITSYGVFPVLVAMEDIQMVHGIDEKISVENLVMGTEFFTEIVETLCW
ncbi:MAG: M20/M25/M40 family metallo-hydrolase [Deltaproteobacteria bacterium]|nr:M20/M25/M40 family metallo-hydrolase [Deltaproteobacteria bacterium]